MNNFEGKIQEVINEQDFAERMSEYKRQKGAECPVNYFMSELGRVAHI